MGINLLPVRYGHYEGHTDICFSDDGDKLLSCGADGEVRIWNGFDDDDPLQNCIGEFALCIKHKGEHIFVGTNTNLVQQLTYPNGDRNGILTRFTAHVNHMYISEAHNWIALASEDMTVKVMEISTKETKTFTINGPPLSVSLCKNLKNLAVSCGDGKLKIFNIEDQSLIKEISVVAKANSFENAKELCRIDFDQKYNKYFAYPDGNKISILNISDWNEAFTLSTDAIDSNYSLVCFSPCGNYVAASTLDGNIAVWLLRSQTIVGFEKQSDIAITSLAWNPKGNGELAFADAQGNVGMATNCTETGADEDDGDIPDEEGAIEEQNYESENIDFGDVQIEAEDDDEDNENAVSLEKLKKEIMGPLEPELEAIEAAASRSPSPRARSVTPEIPLQPAFMPSSTPEHLDPRYMCYNEVGIIRCYGCNLDDDDDGTRSIEVEFHDSQIHSSMMIRNYKGYTMGSISTAALAVANNTVIHVVPLGSSSEEWHLVLEDDEEIVCIAASHNLICLATANYFVHVSTIFGIQKAVISVPGPILTMSAIGMVLIIAYHSTSTRKGDQCVETMLVKFEGTTIENRDMKVALKPGSKLQWLGFTDVGTPAMMDSTGMVYLHPLQCNLWIPFCDTKKHHKSPSDGFFMTAIYESLGTIRGIRCKGSLYPGFTPRPTLTEIEFQPPFLEIGTGKSQYESSLFTMSTLQIEGMEKKYQEIALKSFALAMKNNLEKRAVEFMEMLGNPQLLNLAVKYASKFDKRRLVEKLMDVASKIDADADPPTFNGSSVSTPSTNVIKPNKKLLLESTSKILNKSKSQVSTPTQGTPSSSMINNTPSTSIISTPGNITLSDISILQDEPKNPFLKSLKKTQTSAFNPLSLTDKFAGIEKENDSKSEKRKQPDSSPSEKNKEKQRKLDRFMFSKRN
ncbi:PREDICTED: WD repeat and HMG-box DNA-binding protein 1 isoform X2 [Nicrophorus vespilloides]|uniref:WD repeat and HMG-box DNA-binding protein 1 isoform X2 n=1 Tax=Nicrophorus vespilloides TaxID=110193 RepID=A0ABM1MUH4_NICVS|nr:PREDICTED: WD repeat and HMG-box DNA-binding protein 1 isoform X2 [Nicrophorus vespilloides]